MATNIIKCNLCGQWTAGDKYSCVHCGEIIEEERIKETKVRHEKTSLSFDNIMLVKVYEDDHVIIKFFKKIFQVAQLIYIGILTFVLWLIAFLPG